MKATPAMVVNVCAQTGIGASVVQRVLDIGLADVPDPEEVRAEMMEGLAYGRSVERQMLDARIAGLARVALGTALADVQASGEHPATDEELIAEMERLAGEHRHTAAMTADEAYTRCARMLRERKVKP